MKASTFVTEIDTRAEFEQFISEQPEQVCMQAWEWGVFGGLLLGVCALLAGNGWGGGMAALAAARPAC